MNDAGFIVLYRRLLDSPIWDLPDSDIRLALICLLEANWKDSKWFDGKQMVEIKRGSFITSRNHLLKKCGKRATLKRVRNGLRRLESVEFLKTGTAKGQNYTRITVLNYSRYQDGEMPVQPGAGQGRARSGPGSGQPPPENGPGPGQVRATIEQGNKGTRRTRETKGRGREAGTSPARQLPGWDASSAKNKRLLERHYGDAALLWERQAELRKAVIPRSRPLLANAENLARVAKILDLGHSVDDCLAALEQTAREARKDPKWFNGTTVWRPENFHRTLGQCKSEAPRSTHDPYDMNAPDWSPPP